MGGSPLSLAMGKDSMIGPGWMVLSGGDFTVGRRS